MSLLVSLWREHLDRTAKVQKQSFYFSDALEIVNTQGRGRQDSCIQGLPHALHQPGFLGKDGTCGHLAQSVFFRSLLPGRPETVLKWTLLKRLISCFISQHIFLHMLKSLMFDTFFLEHWGQWSSPKGCPTNIQYDILLKPLGNSAVYAAQQTWVVDRGE